MTIRVADLQPTSEAARQPASPPTPAALDWPARARTVAHAAAEAAPALDHDGAFPEEDVARLREAGLLLAPLPVEAGGAGLGIGVEGAGALAAVLEWIGWGSLPLGRLYEGHVNALGLIARYGTPDQARTAAREVEAGHFFGVWNTEGPGGLRLEGDEAGGPLQGGKTYASGSGWVTRPLVTARTPDDRLLMVVPPVEPGTRHDLSPWRAHGMRASATGSLDFSGIVLEAAHVMGTHGDYHRQPVFSGGAWRFAAVQTGGLMRVLDETRRHLGRTGRGADPHQLARLGQAAIAAESARLWVARAAATVAEPGPDPEQTVAYVNLARLAVERAGLDVLELAHRSVGLQGFLRDHPLERLTRDLSTYLRQPAPDRALTQAAGYVLEATGDTLELWDHDAGRRVPEGRGGPAGA